VKRKKKASRVRDLAEDERWHPPAEVLTIAEFRARRRLAQYYTRRAGIGDPEAVIERVIRKKSTVPIWVPASVIVLVLLMWLLSSSCVTTQSTALPGTTVEYLQENSIYKGQLDVYSSKTYMRTGTYLQANPIYRGQTDIKTNGGKSGVWKSK
jgi:hypothetical protein